MGYYVKGFGSSPLILQLKKTNHQEIIDGQTPRQAILNCICVCQKKITEWNNTNSPHSQKITKDMTDALVQLNQLLKSHP